MDTFAFTVAEDVDVTISSLRDLNALRLSNGITRSEYDMLKHGLLRGASPPAAAAAASSSSASSAPLSTFSKGSRVVLTPDGFAAAGSVRRKMSLISRRTVVPGQRATVLSAPGSGGFVEVELNCASSGSSVSGWISARLCRSAADVAPPIVPAPQASATTPALTEGAPFWTPPTGSSEQLYRTRRATASATAAAASPTTGATYGAACGGKPSVSYDDGETWTTYTPAALAASVDYAWSSAAPRCARDDRHAATSAALAKHGIEYAHAAAERGAPPLASLDTQLNPRTAPKAAGERAAEQLRRCAVARHQVVAMIRGLVTQRRGPMCLVSAAATRGRPDDDADDILAHVWARCWRGPTVVLAAAATSRKGKGSSPLAPPPGVPLLLACSSDDTAQHASLVALYAARGEEPLFATLRASAAVASKLIAFSVGSAIAMGSSPLERPWLAGRSPNGRVYAMAVHELAKRVSPRRAAAEGGATLSAALHIGGVAMTREKGAQLLQIQRATTTTTTSNS